MLKHKFKGGVHHSCAIMDRNHCPKVCAPAASELNQGPGPILIVNAVEAMKGKGRVAHPHRAGETPFPWLVEIIDKRTGRPGKYPRTASSSRSSPPKPVGEGTGLGPRCGSGGLLRIITGRHRGWNRSRARPGFQVRIPLPVNTRPFNKKETP